MRTKGSRFYPELRKMILDVLSDAEGPLRTFEIRRAFNFDHRMIDQRTTSNLLTALRRDGLVERAGEEEACTGFRQYFWRPTPLGRMKARMRTQDNNNA